MSTCARVASTIKHSSRAFHFAIAAATGNGAFAKLLDGLWIADVGRRLLAQRRRSQDWQDHDVAEHRVIIEALEAGDGERAARLMSEHVESAVRHWSPRGEG